jgi:drug/metabolite transporter (DMT)-like permease
VKHAGGRLAAAGAGVAFGALGIFAHTAYADGADALGLLPFRFVTASAVLALIAWRTDDAWPAPRRILHCLLLGGAGYFTFTLVFFAALKHASPGVAALLLYLNPFVVFAWSVLLGWERFRVGALVTLIVAIGGLALVLIDGTASRLGVLLGVLTAAGYGTYLVVSSRALKGLAPSAATSLIALGAGIAALIAAALAGGTLPHTAPGWWALAGMTIISTVIALALLTLALQRTAPAEVSVIMLAEPITAVVLSAIVLGHALTPLQVTGAAITLGACAYFVRRNYGT